MSRTRGLLWVSLLGCAPLGGCTLLTGLHDVPDVVDASQTKPARDASSREAATEAGDGDALSPKDSAATESADGPLRDARSEADYVDAGRYESGVADATTAHDSSVQDGGRADARPEDAASSCDPPTTDIYVDGSLMILTSAQNGSQGCPFSDVESGVAAAGFPSTPVTVHVASGTYSVNAITLNANVTLLAEPSTQTVLSAPGATPCGSTGIACAVLVGYGAVLDGFTVTCAKGNAIVTPPKLSTEAAPVIRHVTAGGSMGSTAYNGVLALEDVTVGPGFSATFNGQNGLAANNQGTITVVPDPAGIAINHFDANAQNGIALTGPSALMFGGGTASNNLLNGINVTSSVANASTPHQLAGITADGNGSSTPVDGGAFNKVGAGVVVTGPTSLDVVGTANEFDENVMYGINFSSYGSLTFGGGTARGNGSYGVRLSGLPIVAGTTEVPALLTHSIKNLSASSNGVVGLGANLSGAGPMMLTLRNTSLASNVTYGLLFDYGSSTTTAQPSVLDIGTSTSSGGNVFGVPGGESEGSGITLRNVPPGLIQVAQGDTFSACPPTSIQLTSINETTPVYYDVAFFTAGVTMQSDPVSAPGCTTNVPP